MNLSPTAQRLRWPDMVLILIFMLGLYTSINIQITARIPVPSALAGFAGLILLWRRRNSWQQSHLTGLAGLVLLYLATILVAPDWHFLGKRFTGLVQIVYSLVIAYALFLTLTEGGRRQISNLFLGLCIAIVVGCLLEQYGGLRPISDEFRNQMFTRSVVYEADLRDIMIYGRIRPKLFTSEPSAVTFGYTFFGLCWYMFSTWRWKFLGYLAVVGIGMVAMQGPTLLLMLVLIIPYEMFLGGRNRAPGVNFVRLCQIGALSLILVAAFIGIGSTLYSARLEALVGGKDASFFARQTGPALVAKEIAKTYPMTGVGLTGEPFIENEVVDIYMRSPLFSTKWKIPRAAEVLTNYFWLHWIYLGVGCGVLVLVGLTIWLRLLGVPAVLFCWSIWIILGQAAGAYVGPRTWVILLIPGAAAVLHRYATPTQAPAAQPATRLRYERVRPLPALGR